LLSPQSQVHTLHCISATFSSNSAPYLHIHISQSQFFQNSAISSFQLFKEMLPRICISALPMDLQNRTPFHTTATRCQIRILIRWYPKLFAKAKPDLDPRLFSVLASLTLIMSNPYGSKQGCGGELQNCGIKFLWYITANPFF
jgi:hypothetical protein